MGKEQEFGSTDEKDAIWAEEDPRTASEAFSRILESVGTGGRWQWRLYLLTAFSGTFTALHNLGAGELSNVIYFDELSKAMSFGK